MTGPTSEEYPQGDRLPAKDIDQTSLQRTRDLLEARLELVNLKLRSQELEASIVQLEKRLELLEAGDRSPGIVGAHEGLYKGPQAKATKGIRVFIGHGHSQAWRQLKDHLIEQHGLDVMAYETSPTAGLLVPEVLQQLYEQASFALLVHTAEDETKSDTLRARQNVVHETGLFQGKLGLKRAIILREKECEPFSNLSGVQQLVFVNIREIFGDIVATIHREFGASW